MNWKGVNAMKSYYIGSLLMVLLGASGCIPLFEQPLPAVPDEMSDPGLLGTWIGTGENTDCQVSFLPRSSGWMDVVYLTGILLPAQTNGVESTLYEGYTAVVGKRRFLCLRLRSRDFVDHTEPPTDYPYMLLTYSVSNGNELSVYMTSESAVREKIETGAWSGRIDGGSSSNEVRVTFSGEQLAEALTAADIDALLNETPLTFRRCP